MNKNIIYIAVGIFMIMVVVVFYPSDEEPAEPIHKEVIKDEPTVEKEAPVEVVYEEPKEIIAESNDEQTVQKALIQEKSISSDDGFVQNIYTSDVVDIYNLEIEEKEITLFSTIDNKNKHSISLKSSHKIKSILPDGKQIILNGDLEYKGEKTQFTLSFNEYYKDYIHYTYIEVTNKDTNETASCDGSFLGAMSPEYRYFITLDFYGYALSCYMDSQEEDTTENKKNMFAKDLNISTSKNLPPIKEKTLDTFFNQNNSKE